VARVGTLEIPGSPPSWGLDVPQATALCKTFLLRMLNVRNEYQVYFLGVKAAGA
jgi:hypothetical protein